MIVELGDRQIELTDEQIAAFEKLTKLQRGVALATLRGEKPADAHRIAGGTCKNEANNARAKLGSEILNKPEVREFLDLMAVDPAPDIASAVLSRDEILQDLTDIARTDLRAVASFTERPLIDMENGMEVLSSAIHVKSMDEIPEYAWKAIKSVKQTKHGLELVLHDSMQARKQISDMCGHNAPIKTELSGEVTTRQVLSDFYE
jgi:phage terminase small subunit